ncbi:MAG: hypothetical protein P8I99_08860 [Acidimicrobiales bacterium]|nr:hypothetical protein [Acidimicrobiales bacterium]MDG1877511.1 hypothetical protein [Acidimicrobiales bacterium]
MITTIIRASSAPSADLLAIFATMALLIDEALAIAASAAGDSFGPSADRLHQRRNFDSAAMLAVGVGVVALFG